MASDAYAENRAAEVYGGMIPLTIIATVAVVLRMIARRVAGTTYWWDDLTVVVALVSVEQLLKPPEYMEIDQ